MAVMTAQPPLPLVPDDARPVGAAAAIVEDDDGGRVVVTAIWPTPGTPVTPRRGGSGGVVDADQGRYPARGRRGVRRETGHGAALGDPAHRRWCRRVARRSKGPKRKSKLTGDTVAAIRRLREGGASYRAVAAATGVSEGSVCNALEPTHTDAGTDESCAPPGSDVPSRRAGAGA